MPAGNDSKETKDAPDRSPVEWAEVRCSASEALARQSVPGIFGHWVLVAVLLATTSASAAHPRRAGGVGVWMLCVGTFRLVTAKAFDKVYPLSPAGWSRLFQTGLVLSSATWGVVG